jgi:hypothetical protein
LYERSLKFIKQDSCHTAKVRIVYVHRYCCQAGACIEWSDSNACYAAWDANASQTGATLKHIASNACDAIYHDDICQTETVVEGRTCDAANATAYRDAG